MGGGRSFSELFSPHVADQKQQRTESFLLGLPEAIFLSFLSSKTISRSNHRLHFFTIPDTWMQASETRRANFQPFYEKREWEPRGEVSRFGLRGAWEERGRRASSGGVFASPPPFETEEMGPPYFAKPCSSPSLFAFFICLSGCLAKCSRGSDGSDIFFFFFKKRELT